MKLFLDPGHGGKDPGAVAAGYREKDIALNIAHMVGMILEEAGAEVRMSRERDVFVCLAERAMMANEWGADLFLSIHCNSAASSAATGTESLVYAENGRANDLAGQIADRIGQDLHLTNRGVKVRPELAVLNSTHMDAVLVETAFISNAKDRNKLLIQPEDFAAAIAGAVQDWSGLKGGEDDVNRYHYTADMPDWGRATVQKLLDKGYLTGKAPDDLDLSEDMIRLLVVNDRAGLYE